MANKKSHHNPNRGKKKKKTASSATPVASPQPARAVSDNKNPNSSVAKLRPSSSSRQAKVSVPQSGSWMTNFTTSKTAKVIVGGVIAAVGVTTFLMGVMS